METHRTPLVCPHPPRLHHGGNHRPRNAPTASAPPNNPQYRVHGRKSSQPSRTIHHPIPLAPICPERKRLGHLYRRPSATPTHTLPVPTTAPATNSQQQFTVPQSIRPRTSAAPHQPPARAHVNVSRRVQLIEPNQPPARAYVNGPRRVQLIEPMRKAPFREQNIARTTNGNQHHKPRRVRANSTATPQPIQPTQKIYTPAVPNRQETPQGLGHIAPIGETILQAPPNHKQRAWHLQAPQTSLNEPTGQLPRPARRTMVRLLHGDTIRRRRHKMGHTLHSIPSRPIPHLLTQRIHSTATTQQPPPRLPAPLPR
jgi:hypothetical protein